MGTAEGVANEPPWVRPSGVGGPYSLLNREHPVERDFRPKLLLVGDNDAVVHLSGDEAFEHPQEMVRRDTEHRGAEAAELIERIDRAPGRHFTCEAIDEVDLG